MFILKKVLSNFLYPVPLVLILSLAGLYLLWFTRRQKTGRILVSAGIIILFLFSNTFINFLLIGNLERKYPPDRLQISGRSPASEGCPVKFIVVLGGGHLTNTSLPVTGELSGDAAVRLIEGVRLYRKCPGAKLVVSGGRGSDPVPHAVVLAELAVDMGVDGSDIMKDARSKDTKDEARYLKSVVGGERFFLVTSAYHMPRAMALFENNGMNPVAAPTGHRVRRYPFNSPGAYFPGAANVYDSRIALHEYIGMLWATIRGQI